MAISAFTFLREVIATPSFISFSIPATVNHISQSIGLDQKGTLLYLSMAATIRVGVLALQGSFREHMTLLHTIDGISVIEVRTKEELESISGLIIPGQREAAGRVWGAATLRTGRVFVFTHAKRGSRMLYMAPHELCMQIGPLPCIDLDAQVARARRWHWSLNAGVSFPSFRNSRKWASQFGAPVRA